jgi:hypothetical protein
MQLRLSPFTFLVSPVEEIYDLRDSFDSLQLQTVPKEKGIFKTAFAWNAG